MSKREAYWVHDDKGGYWQIPVEGEAYNFRTPPGFVMHPAGEAVTDSDILWDMRLLDTHLKDSDSAIPVLVQGVRRILRRVMRPAEAQGGGDMTECGHSKYVPCHNCEPLDAPPSEPVGVPAGVVREYLDAHACYDPSTQHPNSPEGLRLREARNDLDAALYLARLPSAAPALPLPGDRGSVQPLFNPQPPAEAQAVAPTDGSPFDMAMREYEAAAIKHGRGRDNARAVDAAADRVFALYNAKPPSAPVGVAADILRIVDTAIDVCNDRDRPAMAEDLEAVRLYVEQASAALAQQPAAVNEAMAERIAALLHEEATDEPWSVAGVEHDGPDRDYYRTLARKVIALAAQQPAASDELTELVRLLDEVRSHFTRDDDLPDDLLPRIDAALAAQPGDKK